MLNVTNVTKEDFLERTIIDAVKRRGYDISYPVVLFRFCTVIFVLSVPCVYEMLGCEKAW